jgi:hypothetical protein
MCTQNLTYCDHQPNTHVRTHCTNRVELKPSTLESEKAMSITVDPKSAGDVPLQLNMSWEPLIPPRSSSSTNGSEADSSLWIQVLVSFLKLALVYGVVHYTFPIAVQILRPVTHAQLKAVSPVVDKILGPDVTMSVARVVDGAFELMFPTGFDSMSDPHLLSVWLALTTCFLAGLLTPSVIREAAAELSARRGSRATSWQDGGSKRWVITTEWIASERVRAAPAPAPIEGSDDQVSASAGQTTAPGKAESDGAANVSPVKPPVRQPGCLWEEAGEDEQGVPIHPAFQRFLAGEQGDREKAIKRWVFCFVLFCFAIVGLCVMSGVAFRLID